MFRGNSLGVMGAIKDDLTALFDAERTVRKLHAALMTRERRELEGAIADATKSALESSEEEGNTARLVRIAFLLGDLDGDRVVDLLIDILGATSPEARVAAGEALESLAFDRFKEVALGIERAIERLPAKSPALTELPYLLAEVGEPGCVKLLGKFLKHDDAEAVAAAIEAIAELGDPSAIPLLGPLEKDARVVTLDEEEGGGGERVAISDLAHEARELLEEVAEK